MRLRRPKKVHTRPDPTSSGFGEALGKKALAILRPAGMSSRISTYWRGFAEIDI